MELLAASLASAAARSRAGGGHRRHWKTPSEAPGLVGVKCEPLVSVGATKKSTNSIMCKMSVRVCPLCGQHVQACSWMTPASLPPPPSLPRLLLCTDGFLMGATRLSNLITCEIIELLCNALLYVQCTTTLLPAASAAVLIASFARGHTMAGARP